jgi:hypothetical protein
VKNGAIPTTAKAVQPGMGTSGRRVFPRQSGGDGRNANDEREADRCSLDADRANVTGSSTRWLTTHNQYSRCVKRNVFIYYEQVANGVCFPASFQCGAPSITTVGCQIPN